MCNTYTHTDVYFCNPQIGNTGVFSLKLTISLSFCSQLQDLSLQISKHFYMFVPLFLLIRVTHGCLETAQVQSCPV